MSTQASQICRISIALAIMGGAAHADAQLKKRVQEIAATSEQLARKALAGEPLPDDEIAAIEMAVAEIDQQVQDAAFFLRTKLLGLQVLKRWEREDPTAQEELATLLGGKVESKGRTTGKKLEVKIATDADRCYLMLGMFAAQADDASFEGFTLDLARGRQVQAFHVKPFVGLAEGFCTLGKEKVTARAALEFQGTKNGMRWAVISFARDRLPPDLAGELIVERGDHCDPAYWEAMWTNPVPGTIAYVGREPVVLLKPSAVMSSEALRLNEPNRIGVSGTLSSAPNGSVSFEPRQLEWGEGCPIDDKQWRRALAPASLRIVDCYRRVEKKYAGAWRQIERQRGAARDAGGIAPAVENRATALMKQQDRDTAKCVALDKAARDAVGKVNDRLVDRFLQSPPTDPTGRADRFTRAAPYRH